MPRRRTAVALRAAALTGLLLISGGAGAAYVAYTDDGGPATAVRHYLAALQAGDAAQALSYGGLPSGPRELLTATALAAQRRIGPIDDVRVGAAVRRGDRAEVRATYRLAFPDAPQRVATVIGVHRADGRWRLDRVAVRTQLTMAEAADRATLLGAAVPTSAVLLFPGALPVTFDTPYLQLDPVRGHRELDSAEPRLDIEVAASPAGRRAAIAAVLAGMRTCLAGRGSSLCPLPSDRYVPGSLRGTLAGHADRQLSVRVLDARAGVLEVTGDVSARCSFRRLAFDNTVSGGRGKVVLSARALSYAVTPSRFSWQPA